jgi:hypothetical protein
VKEALYNIRHQLPRSMIFCTALRTFLRHLRVNSGRDLKLNLHAALAQKLIRSGTASPRRFLDGHNTSSVSGRERKLTARGARQQVHAGFCKRTTS